LLWNVIDNIGGVPLFQKNRGSNPRPSTLGSNALVITPSR